MTTYPHPACMEPDGGDGPCAGYRSLMDERDTLSQATGRLREALEAIAKGNCPGSLIDATADALSQAEAQRIFHMSFSSWMQTTARDALKQESNQ